VVLVVVMHTGVACAWHSVLLLLLLLLPPLLPLPPLLLLLLLLLPLLLLVQLASWHQVWMDLAARLHIPIN
jgi:hypothetical protein